METVKRVKQDMRRVSSREGDWVCLYCSNYNYSFRTICKRLHWRKVIAVRHNPSNATNRNCWSWYGINLKQLQLLTGPPTMIPRMKTQPSTIVFLRCFWWLHRSSIKGGPRCNPFGSGRMLCPTHQLFKTATQIYRRNLSDSNNRPSRKRTFVG